MGATFALVGSDPGIEQSTGPTATLHASRSTIEVGESTLITADVEPADADTTWVVSDLSRSSCGPSGTVGPELPPARIRVWGCQAGSGTVSLKIHGGATLATTTITVNGPPTTPPTTTTTPPTTMTTPPTTTTNSPPVFSPPTYAYSVYDNDPVGRNVGIVGATDPDGDTSRLTYEITAGNDDGKFAINASRTITVADQLTQGTFELTVTASDPHGGTATATVTITVEPEPGPISLRSPQDQMGGLQMWARGTDVNPGYCTMSFVLKLRRLGAENEQPALSTTAHCAPNSSWNQGNAGDFVAVGSALTSTPTPANQVPCEQTNGQNDPDCVVGDQSYATSPSTVTTTPGYVFRPGTANRSTRTAPNLDPGANFFESSGSEFRIVSARPPAPGEAVHKVGRTTGWTSGLMGAGACGPQPPVDCAVSAGYVSAPGDSGSPVFVWNSTTADDVVLVGIHFAHRGASARFVPIDRVYAESLDRGYDWGPAEMRPVPVLDDSDYETLKPEGDKIVATFLANEFTPPEYDPVLHYVATLFRDMAEVASTSTFQDVPRAGLNDMSPARRAARFDVSGLSADDRMGAFTVAVKACVDAARTICGEHGSHGTIEPLYLRKCSDGVAVPNPTSTPGLLADCDALLRAKAVLEGDGTALNWSVDVALTSWDGVTVSSTPSRVTRLDLSSRGLTGSIPTQLGSLTNLEHLDLHSNQLTGSIPTQLGSLTNLQYLNLHTNQLTGSIPTQLGGLTSLQRLFLSTNQLTGSIPTQLGNLTGLLYLSLNRNQLTGSIPSQLGSLTNLRGLDLSANRLTGSIPTQLGSLTNLLTLTLSANQLTGSIPTQLGNLTNLRQLYLRDNQLTGSIPTQLGSLTDLFNLDLVDNQLTGSIPSQLGSLDLTFLYLRDNQLTGCIPAALRDVHFNDLNSLGLSYCGS